MAKINKLKEALLSQELLKELLRYEHETGLFYWIKRGKGRKFGQPAGCLDKSNRYVEIMINGNSYKAHRLVWLYVYGEFPQGEQPFIDHVDQDRSNNRVENLKVSSSTENNRNVQMYSTNTSGVTGVHRYKMKTTSGKVYSYWSATWCDENGIPRMKGFSIHTYGENDAKQMAIDYRTKQLCLLEQNHGIKYSERHGI